MKRLTEQQRYLFTFKVFTFNSYTDAKPRNVGGLMLTYYTNAHAQLKAENIDGKIIQIIEYVIANGSIKNLEVQKLLNTSKPTATRLLKQTEKWLEMKNVGRRGIEYHLKRGF